jgi:hypothetical protein
MSHRGHGEHKVISFFKTNFCVIFIFYLGLINATFDY